MITPFLSAKRDRGLYLHFPFCKHLCNYCDFYKSKLTSNYYGAKIHQWHNYLNASLPLLESYFLNLSKETNWSTVYFGGGTPSLWGELAFGFIPDFFSQLQLSPSLLSEWTIEVDPGTTTINDLKSWTALGVTRFSVGVQTFDPQVLPIMDRSHTFDDITALLGWLKDLKCNFSVDLMLGIPTTKYNRNIANEVEELLKYNPNHVSIYIFTLIKNYPHKDLLPSDEIVAREFIELHDQLEKSGYNHYEVSNYAKPGFESKHNLKYWNHEPIVAFGPSGTGFERLGGDALRYKWVDALRTELAFEKLDQEALNLEKLYLTFRQKKPWKWSHFYSSDLSGKLEKISDAWFQEGYLLSHSNGWQFSAKGWILLDHLIGDLLTFPLQKNPNLT
jgi:oxygen-independent coproporphyrinogen-3 oxidase